MGSRLRFGFDVTSCCKIEIAIRINFVRNEMKIFLHLVPTLLLGNAYACVLTVKMSVA